MQDLRKAAQQALEALQIWQDSLTDPSAMPGWRFAVVGEKAIANLRAALGADTRTCTCHPDDSPPKPCQRKYALSECLDAALAEDAMQRLTDVQQELDCYGDGNVYRGQRSSDSKTPTLTINGMPAVEGPLSKAHRTCQESRQVEPVAFMHKNFERRIREVLTEADFGGDKLAFLKYCMSDGNLFPLYTTAPPGIVARAVATERERIAAWVEDMCVGLDAKTIANGIRNGGNDDIRAFEVRND